MPTDEECDGAIPVELTFQGTQVDERTVELPAWNTPWNRLVYPLLVSNSARNLFPLGTGFRFSSLGHVLTAAHNVEEAFISHHPQGEEFRRQGLSAALKMPELTGTHLTVMSQGTNPRIGDTTLDIRGFSTLHTHPSTDLLVGNILSNRDSTPVPWIQPTISFAPPRIGEIVRCVGYTDMKGPANGLSQDEVNRGVQNPYEHYHHKLICVTGRVKHLFTRRLARGFIDSPCFSIDAEVPHGLSGGPIFRQDGIVCGMVSAGGTHLFGEPMTIGSLLYPIFLLRLSFGIAMGGGVFRLNATERPVAELVSTQAIQTDGSEMEQLHFSQEEEGVRIGIRFHKEDASFVFEDLGGLERGEPAPPLPPDLQLKAFSPNLDHPLVKKRRQRN